MMQCRASAPWAFVPLLLLVALAGCRRPGVALPGTAGVAVGSAATAPASVPLAQAESDGKVKATELLWQLPMCDSFEWAVVSPAAHDPDVARAAVPDERQWQASGLGELFTQFGISMNQALCADWMVEVSGPGRDCVVWTWSAPDTLSEVRSSYCRATGAVPGAEGDIRALSSGAPAAAFSGGSLLLGQPEAIEGVADALSYRAARDSLADDFVISDIWAELPAGFRMTVARGGEHSFLSGAQQVEGWGESTTKLNASLARTTFISQHASSDDAIASEDAIRESAEEFIDSTGRRWSIESVDAWQGRTVVVFTKPLADAAS